jgi:hypothetical protein
VIILFAIIVYVIVVHVTEVCMRTLRVSINDDDDDDLLN